MYVKPNMETSKHNSMKREVSNKSDDTYKGDPWKVIESYFSGTHLKRAVRHQIESYNDFVQVQITKTINPTRSKPIFDPFFRVCLQLSFQNRACP